ncbi:hypothetical protein HG530_005201 [Fusarium avenaceum]|nr:hypothetical protein HG530_005201 [Fusarium avenaceum]
MFWYLNLVARVGDLGGGSELLLDGPNVDEASQEVLATGLVISTRGTRTTKGLLADNSTSALAVDVEVTGSVAELLLGEAGSLTVSSENGTSQAVVGGGLDELADIGDGVGSSIVVDVCALGRVVFAANNELEVLVSLGLIDGTRELLERRLVDDGTHEVGVVSRVTDLDSLNLSDKLLLELGPHGLGDVDSRSGTALLTLELEGTTDSLLDSVVNLGRGIDQVEVLSTSLTNDAGVASVSALSNTLADGAVELTEDGGASSVVESSKLLVLEDDLGDVDGVTGDKLDNILGETSLNQDLVDEPVGSNGEITGLPDNDVTEKSRGTRQVTGDGSEVEGADSIDKTLKGTVLDTVPDTRRVVHGLGVVELLGVVNVEAEEVSQLGGGVDLGLPSVLALAEHGSGHDVVSVLGGDEVGGLEEDGSSVVEGEGLPGGLGSQSSVDSSRDISWGGSVVGGDSGGMVGRVLLLGEGGSLDL